MLEMTKTPRMIGTTLEGHTVYDLDAEIELPFPRNPLVPTFFKDVSVLEVVTEMARRKAAFEAEQSVNNRNPGVWENVGYFVEPDGVSITAYHQVGFPKVGVPREPEQTPRFDPATPHVNQRPRTPTKPLWGHGPW